MRGLSLWTTEVGQWLYDWQTLVGASLALIAAYWAYGTTKRQMAQAEQFNRDQIARSHNASRTLLPLTLSSLSELCQRIADNTVQEIEAINENRSAQEISETFASENHTRDLRFESIEIDGEIFSSLHRFVETLTDANDVRHIAELVSSAQILLSRYRTFDLKQIGVEEALNSLLLDAAKVKLLIDKMFNYGRFVDHDSFGIVGVISDKDAWQEILGKAQGLIFHWPQIDRIFAPLADKVRRYSDADYSPWNEKFEAL
jgi:hypothetical protein